MSVRRLGEILETIGEEFVASFTAPTPVPVYLVGAADELARADVANRVVMEPTTRSYEASKGASGALFMRVETVRVHIWGTSLDAVEELEELLMNAIIKTVAWALRPGTGNWLVPSASIRGFVAVQDISFLVPIMRRVRGQTTRPLLTLPITPVLGAPI